MESYYLRHFEIQKNGQNISSQIKNFTKKYVHKIQETRKRVLTISVMTVAEG